MTPNVVNFIYFHALTHADLHGVDSLMDLNMIRAMKSKKSDILENRTYDSQEQKLAFEKGFELGYLAAQAHKEEENNGK